jgi:hypothetical protein
MATTGIQSGTGTTISFAGLGGTVLDITDRTTNVTMLDATPLISTEKVSVAGGVTNNGELVVDVAYEPVVSGNIPAIRTAAVLTLTYPDGATARYNAVLGDVGRSRLHGDELMVAKLTFTLNATV